MRETDRNPNLWHAKLVLATTGLHLARFRHKHRPLAKAVDYAELFIYDEAQQEAALSDLAILGALPRKCLVLRLGDPKQTSGGTGPSDLARKVRLISDQLSIVASWHVELLLHGVLHLRGTFHLRLTLPLPLACIAAF